MSRYKRDFVITKIDNLQVSYIILTSFPGEYSIVSKTEVG